MTERRRARRALLFCPGTDRHKIEKAARLPADGVILDWEDGTALTHKAEARRTSLQALADVDFGRRELIIRVNPAGGTFFTEDIVAIAGGPRLPDTIMLPKVDSSDAILRADEALTDIEEDRRLPAGVIGLIALIETALGVVRLADITAADNRLEALAFGAEDLAGDLGVRRTRDGLEVLHARSAVVLYAAAFDLQALDTPFVDLADLDGLAADARLAEGLGYSGKLAIHPAQLEPILAAFTPSPEAVAAARRLIDAHEQHQREGQGVFQLDGRMVDMPMIRAATRVLDRAPED